MVATDTITPMLQMLQRVQARAQPLEGENRKLQEQHLADQRTAKELRIASKEKACNDMQKMLQELHTRRTPASADLSTDRFSAVDLARNRNRHRPRS